MRGTERTREGERRGMGKEKVWRVGKKRYQGKRYEPPDTEEL